MFAPNILNTRSLQKFSGFGVHEQNVPQITSHANCFSLVPSGHGESYAEFCLCVFICFGL